MLPALGALSGGVLAELLLFSRQRLSLTLHFAAGVVLGIVGVDLLPRSLLATTPWVVLIAFAAGSLFYVGLDWAAALIHTQTDEAPAKRGPWVLVLGNAVDFLSDGVLVGAGSSVHQGVGFVLAFGLFISNVPSGIATGATLKRSGVARRQRIVIAAGFAMTVLAGTGIGYWTLHGRPPIVRLSVLMFTAGMLVLLVVEEMIPRAHRADEARLAALLFAAGFLAFATIALYLS